MEFSEKLKKIRKDNNLTQEELAEKLNVSRQAITKWESGDGIPDIENLKELSDLFNTTIDELIKEDKTVTSIIKKQYNYTYELEIDHTKHFDINLCRLYELNIIANKEEKVQLDLSSDIEDDLNNKVKVIFDDLYDNLDIDVKNKNDIEDLTINLYLPEKYINEIEINSKIKTLNISNLKINELEYDGELKYLNVNNSKGDIILNTTRCDIEANFDKLDGNLEVNIVNSVARVSLPKDSEYKTILNGIKNEFVDANNNDKAINSIELNGMNSKLIIIEK